MTYSKQNIDLTITRLLLSIGFNPHLFGMTYVCEAIKYCVLSQHDGKVSFSGEVYPFIASNHNSSSKSVERDIRTSIQNCYDSKLMFKLNQICGYEIVSQQYAPTNSEFIMKTAYWFKTLDFSTNE